jgi:hypothetical protein
MHKKKLVMNRVTPIIPIVRTGPRNVIMRNITIQQFLMKLFIHFKKEIFGTTIDYQRQGVRG